MRSIRKILAISGIILFSSFQARAQKSPIHIGLEFGGNWSELHRTIPSSAFNFGKRLLYNATMGIEYRLSERYSLDANLRYIFWGDNEKSENTRISSSGVNIRISQKYLDMALLMHVYLPDEFSGVYAVFGPEFGYLLNARFRYRVNAFAGYIPIREDSTMDILHYMHRWNILADAGLGYVLNRIKPHPFLQVIYSLGLIKTSKRSFSSDSWSTRGLLFNVGIRF